jgi:hypothetical protein
VISMTGAVSKEHTKEFPRRSRWCNGKPSVYKENLPPAARKKSSTWLERAKRNEPEDRWSILGYR